MQELISQMNDSNVEVRREAVEKLRGMRNEACIPVLLKAMEDVSWRVRKTAVDILFDEYEIEQYIHGLVQLLYIEDNAGARNSAIEAMIKLGKRATLFLIEAFKTPNRDVRKFIIDVLGEQRDSRALPLMLEAIRDEDENVSATAVEHLGKVREVSVVEALLDILNSGDLWTAYPAADALGRIGDRRAVPHLLAALARKPLREPILKALGRLADPSTLDQIIPMLQDPSKNIQEQALKTLERFYHNGVDPEFITSEMRRILGDAAVDLLIGYAWSVKREVRISAILLLGLMRDDAAYGPLLDISHEEEFAEDVQNALVFIGKYNPESLLRLFETENSHQLRFICEVTARIVSPVYYDVLFGLLSDEDGHVRATAAVSISRLQDLRAAPKVKTLMTDPYEDVQEAAVEALATLHGALTDAELVAMLKDDSPVLRKNTAKLIGRLKAAELVDDLGFALKDAQTRVREAVVESLAAIGSEDAVRYLTYALTDEEPPIRISAALSLGEIGGKGVLDSLMILSSDPDNAVRVAAARALGALKDREAVKTLISLLQDSSGFVVTSAIESLGATGGEIARQAIIEMLSAPDDEIRRTAITALASFEGVERFLLPFLQDKDWAARIAAVRTLGMSASPQVRQELERLLDTEEDPTVIKAVEETLRV
ncbi:MAG: HEAT repeat domain-containing protein [Nitrospiraceae bacterium]|nr:HEAT repeat domain-containing protein [Nitrospiraceae bacterium]